MRRDDQGAERKREGGGGRTTLPGVGGGGDLGLLLLTVYLVTVSEPDRMAG